MANRSGIALAVFSALSFLPMTAQAGAGIGIPTAPAAGKSSDYCCIRWRPVEIRRGREDEGKVVHSFMNGEGCQLLDPADFIMANNCPGAVVKCRGELFSPTAQTESGLMGKVERCLTP